jgi:hypothetical protein
VGYQGGKKGCGACYVGSDTKSGMSKSLNKNGILVFLPLFLCFMVLSVLNDGWSKLDQQIYCLLFITAA